MIGVDVSVNQKPGLPWPAWVAAGLGVACVQLTHVDHPEGNATAHLQGAAAAGVPSIGCYHWLGGGGAKECRYFLSFLPAAAMWAMVDVEDPHATAASLADFCAWWDAHDARALVLYGNNQLAAFVEARPELKRYGVWYAAYPTFPLPCTAPPFPEPRNVPASLAGRVVGWQYAGDNGKLPPYVGNIDLTEWHQLPTEGVSTMPKTLTDVQVAQISATLDTIMIHLADFKTAAEQSSLNAQGNATWAKTEIDALVALRPVLVVPPPPPPVKHTMATLTNQQVLNLFKAVFGGFAECDAAGLTAKLAAARGALYVGPAIEDLPSLSAGQKTALIAGLG